MEYITRKVGERSRTTPGYDNDRTGGGISNIDTFQHLQATFSANQRARPPDMEFPAEVEENRVPLKPQKFRMRESRGGLRGLLTRNKVDKNAVLPVLEDTPPSAISETSMNAIAEKALDRSSSLKKVATLPDSTPAVPSTPKPASKPSRMNLRSMSVKRKPPKSSPKSSTKSSTKPATRTSATWDPPPLFQAYPQAIKHATLSASTMSADSILRTSNHKRNHSLRDEIAQTRANVSRADQSAAAKKAGKARSKHQRQISGSISKADWIQKIFVLVTSGYLLQYAGEGSFDRLPEKMMQLGKDSVAFASDVIPGKHWVLQISQSMAADGTPTADSRSLLSRLTFRGADYRRTATSLLLVLNSAEDMDSWIAVVRREIEALGGKKHVSETGKPKPDDKVMQLKAQPSHRYLIPRNPDQSSNPASPSSPSFGPPPWTKDERLQEKLEDAASALSRPLSTLRPSTGHGSVTNSVISYDGRQLESLPDSANRLSHMSSGQRTLITSESSSTASSPIHEHCPTFDEFPPRILVEDVRPRPNAAAINERRRSMQKMQIPSLEVPSQPKNFRHSAFGVPSRPPRSHSPPPPNFSTPKRSSSSRVLIPEAPPISTMVTTTPTPNRSRDSILRGTRKAPPAAVKIVRPLSLVEDSLSPCRQAPPVFTPTESSFKMVQQVKPSVVDIPPRSPSVASNPTSPVGLPRRISSLMPLASNDMAKLDFQFPQRISSTQILRDAVDEIPGEPGRAAPLPPAALTTPLPISPFSPGQQTSNDHNQEIEPETLSPLPVLANSKQKLRRPPSMQIRPPAQLRAFPSTTSTKSISSPSHRPVSNSTWAIGATSPASIAGLSPSSQSLKVPALPKVVANRRSMPTLVNGPPPAPPPDCALPPLPPGTAALRSTIGVRSSVRV